MEKHKGIFIGQIRESYYSVDVIKCSLRVNGYKYYNDLDNKFEVEIDDPKFCRGNDVFLIGKNMSVKIIEVVRTESKDTVLYYTDSITSEIDDKESKNNASNELLTILEYKRKLEEKGYKWENCYKTVNDIINSEYCKTNFWSEYNYSKTKEIAGIIGRKIKKANIFSTDKFYKIVG